MSRDCLSCPSHFIVCHTLPESFSLFFSRSPFIQSLGARRQGTGAPIVNFNLSLSSAALPRRPSERWELILSKVHSSYNHREYQPGQEEPFSSSSLPNIYCKTKVLVKDSADYNHCKYQKRGRPPESNFKIKDLTPTSESHLHFIFFLHAYFKQMCRYGKLVV